MNWIQTLHYEGNLFRYRKYCNIGHLAAQCGLQRPKFKNVSSWWKGASFEHYIIAKKRGPISPSVNPTMGRDKSTNMCHLL